MKVVESLRASSESLLQRETGRGRWAWSLGVVDLWKEWRYAFVNDSGLILYNSLD